MASRREFVLMLLAGVAWLQPLAAHASEDDSGSGGSGSGNSGSGSGGSGSGSGGSGSGNSGSGSDDSGSGSGNSGSGSGNSGSGNDDGDDDGNDDRNDDDEQTKARKAVERGDAIALRKVLTSVSKQYPGRVVSVRLAGNGSNLSYRIRVIDTNNRLLNLVVNARTGQINAGNSN